MVFFPWVLDEVKSVLCWCSIDLNLDPFVTFAIDWAELRCGAVPLIPFDVSYWAGCLGLKPVEIIIFTKQHFILTEHLHVIYALKLQSNYHCKLDKWLSCHHRKQGNDSYYEWCANYVAQEMCQQRNESIRRNTLKTWDLSEKL